VVRLFARGEEAALIAHLTGLSRTTVNDYLRKIRMSLAAQSVLDAGTAGRTESGTTLFALAAVRRGVRNTNRDKGEPLHDPSLAVMRGLLTLQGQVHLEIPPDRDQDALKLIRKGRMDVRGWTSNGHVREVRLEIDLDFQGQEQREILERAASAREAKEVIPLFLAYLRARVARLRGVPADTTRLHFKEAEYRFNTARTGGSLSRRILAILRDRPLV